MKTISALFILALSSFVLNAQNLIAVEHNGASTFYSTLDSAVNAAQTGDNVHVPGGNFTLSVPISKGFHVIGVGYNPDSTLATGFTQINNLNEGNSDPVHIISGADNGSLSGIYFSSTTIQFGTSTNNQTVNNYTITRCRIYGGSLSLGYSGTTNSTNLVFTENVFGGQVNGVNIQNCTFIKNVFEYDQYNFGTGNQYINNIFLFYSAYVLSSVHNSTFKNNIYLFNGTGQYFSWNSSGNVFENNIFTGNLSGYLPGQDINSLYNVAQSSIFKNQSGNTYDYHHDYHLKSTCPGKNYGTDGTDLGVYGTATPWKEGGVPYNPHIQFQSIGTTTNQGSLNVNIKVAAQNN